MKIKKFEPIAIVGVSAIFPGDGETSGFWRDILAGRDLIRDIPESYWLTEDYYDADPKAPDKVYAKRGAFLSGIDFDAMGFGIPPQILPETDSAQLLALVGAKRVLDEVTREGLPELDKNRVSVILGVTAAQKLAVEMNARIQRPLWAKAMREAGLPEERVQAICDRISSNYVPWRENTFPGLLGNVIAGRIANRFNLGGTNCVTDAACASSFAALSMAVQELHLGHSDLAITGGVDTFNDPFMYMCFSKTPALSATGDCRPFSGQADGTILGEGVGMFALKRLADAERDGNTVYAVIRGLGTSSDGRAKSVYAPLPEGQAKALRKAYESAGYSPATVELVEAHGTGTVAGDQAEFEGLKIAFEEAGRADRQWCAMGTVKSQIGHTKAAAGAAGLYKAAMALHHKILPPTIKVSEPNPKFGLPESPFYLNTQARPWIRDKSHPRRASVSSFGFGGSNFHLTLEEHVGAPGAVVVRGSGRGTKIRSLSSELIVLSAGDSQALIQVCEKIRTDEMPGVLRHWAELSQRTFDPHAPVRLALVAKDAADLRGALALAISKIRALPAQDFVLPAGTCYSANTALSLGKIAFIFSGQGSQYLGMGSELAMAWDDARSAWDFAADVEGLAGNSQLRLHHFAYPRPVFSDEERRRQEVELMATEIAQPAIGVVSQALLRVLEKLGVRADCVAGHSFGEVTALHAAGVLETEAFLRIARKRGELMAQASGASGKEGAMLAVGASAQELEPLLSSGGTGAADVVIANLNGPRETVLAGTRSGVERVEALLTERGLTCRRLLVATAFHSPLVEAASRPFLEFLNRRTVHVPRIPVYSNTTAHPYSSNPSEIRKELSEQLKNPVRFIEMIQSMYADGVRTFVQVGPSSALTRLVDDILADQPHCAVALDQRNRDAATSLWRGLGKLAVSGVELDFSSLWMEYGVEPQALDQGRSGVRFKISGANYGKPQPVPLSPGPVPSLLPSLLMEKTPMHSNPPVPANEENGNAPEVLQPLHAFGDSGFLGAFAEIHRSTAEAHSAYQRSMAESHAAFLKASEETLSCLSAFLQGGTAPARTRVSRPASAALPVQSAPSRSFTQPRMQKAPMQAPLPATVPAPTASARSTPVAQPQVMAAPSSFSPSALARPTQSGAFVGDPVGAPARASVIAAAPSTSAVPAPTLSTTVSQAGSGVPTDLKAVLFEVVAEKTGYPSDMLKPEMELEADLGIDSIKRVEILSALKKRVPGLVAATAQETASMRSLQQIIHFTEKKAFNPASCEPSRTPGPP